MIYLNGIPSFRKPEKDIFLPDDRLQKIELINGVTYQDLGIVGGVFALQCLFSAANFAQIQALWKARTKVTYVNEAGVSYAGLTIKMTEWQNDKNFPNYVLATFELWREE